MIRNYLLTFARILSRQKIYSAINVFGLSIGIATSLLIGLYIADELSYDRFHKDANKIYRLGFRASQSGTESSFCLSGSGIAQILREEIPEVESTLRIKMWPEKLFQYKDKTFNEKNILRADTNVFRFFSFTLLKGNPKTALLGADKIVITETIAKKYFDYKGSGDASCLGQILVVGEDPMQVSGIVADPPANSHFHFSSIVALGIPDSVKYRTVYTYFKTSNIKDVEKKFPLVYSKMVNAEDQKLWSSDGNYYNYFTQGLFDIHLNSHHSGELESNGSLNQLYQLGLIALFIVVLACINFMNLTTARAVKRVKEIGIRKVSGALRSRIIKQFMLEAYLYSGLAICFGLFIISISLNGFNLLVGKSLSIESLTNPVSLAIIGCLWIFIGSLSGSYPSVYLSSVKPVDVLKGKLSISERGTSIRNFLVVFQFLVSISLIIATVTVYRQIKFMQSKDLGFDKENILYLNNAETLGENKVTFKSELSKYNGVIAASFSDVLPTEIESQYIFNVKGSDVNHVLRTYGTDHDQGITAGYQLVQGRFFSSDVSTDSSAVVLNEAAANVMGIDLNKKVILEDGEKEYEVIGIIRDFNYESLKNEIRPLLLYIGGSRKVMIRLAPGDIQTKIDLVKMTWKKFTNAPFEYGFLDDRINRLYFAEKKFGEIAMVFSCIAVIIACLGLLGLVTYIASLRSKEIGIRKVLGANAIQIVILISREFIWLLLISLFIAIPITWYSINKWLETFAYRIEFNIGIATFSGVLVLIIALFTVSYQSFKAALVNPADSLKLE